MKYVIFTTNNQEETVLHNPRNIMTAYEYKCRRCNKVFVDGVCPATVPQEVIDGQLKTIPAFQSLPGSIAFKPHKCGDGGAGLADWIGCRHQQETHAEECPNCHQKLTRRGDSLVCTNTPLCGGYKLKSRQNKLPG